MNKFTALSVAAVTVLAPIVSAPPASAATKPVDVKMVNLTGHAMELECSYPQKSVALAPGQSATVTGKAGTFDTGSDVRCRAYVIGNTAGEARFDVGAKNPHVGNPSVTIYTHKHRFNVDETWNTSYNYVHVQVKRLHDTGSGHKSFEISFRV